VEQGRRGGPGRYGGQGQASRTRHNRRRRPLSHLDHRLWAAGRGDSSLRATEGGRRQLFRPLTLACVFGCSGLTVSDEEADVGTIARAAFSSILLPVCRETRHWGYVCDNSAPKGDYERDVVRLFVEKLRAWTAAYKDRDAFMLRMGVSIFVNEVITSDASSALANIPSGDIKLILTSPPYNGVSDYVKAQRLSMEWFGNDIEPFRRQEIGARSKRHRKAATSDYISDLLSVFSESHRVLSDDGWFVIVIGESSQRESTIPLIITMIEKTGFDIHATNDRQISISRRQKPSVNKEVVIFMRKSPCANSTT